MNPNEVLKKILTAAKQHGAEFCEAVVWKDNFLLKRIKHGQIDQPPAGESWGIDVAVVKNGRRKTISFDDPTVAEELIAKAMLTMELAREQEIILPERAFPKVALVEGLYHSKTAQLNDKDSIAVIQTIKEDLEKDNLLLSGKILQGRGELVYGNSRGTSQQTPFTLAAAALFAFAKDDPFVSAYTNSGGTAISELDIARMTQELRTKCLLARNKQKVDLFDGKPDGENLIMDIIVEPYFFAPIFEWLGFFGFNGLLVERGESFISGKLGQQVAGENITVKDDPFDKRSGGMGLPFDLEGRPRQPLVLIEHGVAKNAVYDTALAKKWNKKPTGNALSPSARSEGAAPFDLVVEGGATSVEEMIRSSTRPTLWVTKVHYLGMKHYQTATMTGVAQHGVFLVENGQVVAPVENLRFEESIPEALKRVETLSPSRLVFDPMGFGFPSGLVIPAMKIRDFRFVGSTKRTV